MAHLGFGDPIKQYPGQVQVTRAVKVLAPGKHFNNLTPAEAKQSYSKRRQQREKQILEIDNPMLKKAILQSRNIIRRFNEMSPKRVKLKSKEARRKEK